MYKKAIEIDLQNANFRNYLNKSIDKLILNKDNIISNLS